MGCQALSYESFIFIYLNLIFVCYTNCSQSYAFSWLLAADKQDGRVSAILSRCHARDLQPSCNNALHGELQDVRNALRQAKLALERLREVECTVQQVAIDRASSSVKVNRQSLKSVLALQLQLASAMAKKAKPQEVGSRSTSWWCVMI